MTMISLSAIDPVSNNSFEVRIDPSTVEAIEEHYKTATSETSCIVSVKNGTRYAVLGNISTVSSSVNPPPTRSAKVKAFINSSLGIFVLTTIFVTLGGAVLKWSIDQATTRFAEREKRIARERALLVEFDTRVAQMNARASQIKEFTNDDEKASATLCIYHLAGGTGICDSTGTAKGRPLVAILSELYGLGVKTDPKSV